MNGQRIDLGRDADTGSAAVWQLAEEPAPCRRKRPPAQYPGTLRLPGTLAEQGIGEPNTAREDGFFTEKYPFSGRIWLRRTVSLTAAQLRMPHCFLYMERTRMTAVWVNGRLAGREQSLCTPHVYDIAPLLTEETELVISVQNCGYPTPGGHMTSPDTQTNWIGITGGFYLEFRGERYLSDLRTFPDIHAKTVTLRGILHGAASARLTASVYATVYQETAAGVRYGNRLCIARPDDTEITADAEGNFSLTLALSAEAPLWSEYRHALCEIVLLLASDSEKLMRYSAAPKLTALSEAPYSVTFGLREFRAIGRFFELNGERMMLRGKHEAMVFPLHCAAPTELMPWVTRFRTLRELGINHIRFHTCCPPEAAFTAADIVGMLLEPELPFWGTVDAPGGAQYRPEEQAYLLREGLRICSTFGNHPSFVMLSLGNELWGSPEQLGGIIEALRRADPRPLYTQGSNNFQHMPRQLPQEDFWTGVRTGSGRLLRGSFAQCDAPLGWIQTHAPGTRWNYERAILPPEEVVPLYHGGFRPMPLYEDPTEEFFQLIAECENTGCANRAAVDLLRRLTVETREQYAAEKMPAGLMLLTAAAERLLRYADAPGSAADGMPPRTVTDRDFAAEFFRIAAELPPGAPEAAELPQPSPGAEDAETEVQIQCGTELKTVRSAPRPKHFYPTVPVISHEIGQYNCYPDYREIARSQQDSGERQYPVTEPRNLEIFRERLARAGMGDQAEQFFLCSGLLSRDCYKAEIEAAMRTPHLAGFQLLDIQDFPGQGTALVGMYRSDFADKGLIRPEQFRAFCGDLVPLALFGSHVLTAGEPFEVRFAVRNSRPDLRRIICRAEVELNGVRIGSVKESREVSDAGLCGFSTHTFTPVQPGHLVITLSVCPGEGGTDTVNCWELFVFPKPVPVLSSGIGTVHSYSEAEPLLRAGERVLLLPEHITESVPGCYYPDFWNYRMFREISEQAGKPEPVGTMGLCTDLLHPVTQAMFSMGYTQPQWYMPLKHADCAVLDGAPAGYCPIVQMIDNVTRNHRLGLIFECRAGGGSLLVCTVRLHEAPDDPAVNRLHHAIAGYMQSDAFAPEWELDAAMLRRLFG